ncbi:hypothetical protein Plhal304r1_c019g0067781 [Plasmopara halstedii]
MDEQYIEIALCDAIQILLRNNPMANKEPMSPVMEDNTANLGSNDDEMIAMV